MGNDCPPVPPFNLFHYISTYSWKTETGVQNAYSNSKSINELPNDLVINLGYDSFSF